MAVTTQEVLDAVLVLANKVDTIALQVDTQINSTTDVNITQVAGAAVTSATDLGATQENISRTIWSTEYPLVPAATNALGTNTITDGMLTAIGVNSAKVSNVYHPLIETAVPIGAVFTDTVYSNYEKALVNTLAIVRTQKVIAQEMQRKI